MSKPPREDLLHEPEIPRRLHRPRQRARLMPLRLDQLEAEVTEVVEPPLELEFDELETVVPDLLETLDC